MEHWIPFLVAVGLLLVGIFFCWIVQPKKVVEKKLRQTEYDYDLLDETIDRLMYSRGLDPESMKVPEIREAMAREIILHYEVGTAIMSGPRFPVT